MNLLSLSEVSLTFRISLQHFQCQYYLILPSPYTESLAEDAVLERLNTVLEPSRPLVLAEKGSDLLLDEVSSDSTEVKVDDDPESWR